MARCGESHPDQPGVACVKETHPYGDHYEPDAGIWEGPPRPVRIGTKRGRTRIQEISNRIGVVEIERTGAPVSAGVPIVAALAWRERQPQWLAEATAALHQVAKTKQHFTTGDVWPLIDAPPEMRAMVLVVRHGIRLGWMYEDAAKREHGVWRTRDGVEFRLNKLVPIYKSQIYISTEETPDA